MFDLGGVALDNDAKGWHLQFGTEPYTAVVRRVTSLNVPGRDGVVPGLGLDREPVLLKLKVRMLAAKVREFLTLADQASKIALTGGTTEAACELVSAEPENLSTMVPSVDVSVVLRLPGGAWRDVATSTSAAFSILSDAVSTTVMSGLSAPVQDAIVRVKGQATGLVVTDSSGAWFSYSPSIPTGSYLRFHSDTGEAFITGSDTWSGGTDVSGVVDFGGPRGGFELTPNFTDPATRSAGLTVSTSARSGATIEVRGKRAYLV
ncbi:MAG TPA: hypothetical protein VFU07_07085 [Candidatus Lumbricidophila sp.]|nr:hypothetical protein [Candidatus Lumbricidophila sp.]